MIRQALLISALIFFVGGFLLIWDSPPESFMRKQTGQVEEVPVADSYMTDVSSLKFSSSGRQQFLLTSTRAEFFNKKSELTLKQPNIVTIEELTNSDQLSIKAKHGTLSNNGNEVFLQDDVVAITTADEGQTILTSDDMTYLPNSNSATNKGPFKLKSPEVKLSGTGLSANFTNEVFIIKSQVRAIHEPI